MTHKKITKRSILLMVCSLLTLPLLAIADGKHNDKTCYAETAGGIEINSPCSSRKTTCNDDYTCSIDGVAGEMGDGLEKAKDELAVVGDNDDSDTNSDSTKTTIKTSMTTTATMTREKGSGMATGKRQHKPLSTPNTDTPGNKATDYNSSRSNKSEKSGMDSNDSSDDDTEDNTDSSISKSDKEKTDSNKSEEDTDYNSSRSNKNSNH